MAGLNDPMSVRRYLCERYPEFYPLTQEEVDAGWHFCPEWDYLLIGPDDPEWDFCTCHIKINGSINGSNND